MVNLNWQKYPVYKSSGVEWLGDIPEHWEVHKINRCFRTIGSGTTPQSGEPKYYKNGTISWVITGDLNDGILEKSSKYLSETALKEHSALKIFPPGTLLIAMYAGATIGKVAILNFEGCTNQACCALYGSKNVDTKFTFYWFIGQKKNIINLSYGGAQPNISQQTIKSLKISVPPLSEQKAIANFLDEKTAQIDEYIAKKQRIIELLKEQKTVIINQAVTKGINPDVPMKYSGVEWLGEIPEHWEVKRAKYISKIFVPQRNKPELNLGSGLPWITMDDITNSTVNKFNSNYCVSELSALKAGSKPLISGSVIASCVGNFGVASINTNSVIINQQLQAYIPKNINPWFLRYVVIVSKTYFEKVATVTTLVYVNKEGFGEMPVPFPPISEQQEIVSFIEKKLEKIERSLTVIEKEIKLTQEYRTTLISETVTGKIDVRKYHPPQ